MKPMVLFLGQLAVAVGCGGALLLASSRSAYSAIILFVAVVLSLACPRRIMWMALASWSAFWALWAVWQFDLWRNGANKFGEGCYVYGLSAFAFGVASWIRFRSTARTHRTDDPAAAPSYDVASTSTNPLPEKALDGL